MKILHINSYYSTSLFYKNLFENQVKNRLNIDVFVPVSSDFERKDFDYGGYTTISKNHNRYDRCIFHLKHQKIYNDIRRIYDIERYSLLHAHSLFSNGYIALRLKKNYGISYIVAVRNTDVNLFFKKMIHLRKIGLEILKEADQIVFLSEPYKKHVIEKYIPNNFKETIERKASIIPNGIDNFWFNNIGIPKQKSKAPNLKLLQIGDINKNKNIETTIKAVELLKEKGYNVKLNVVGEIKDENVFKKIKDLNYVNFLGFKSKEELINIYRENDIFVMPSIHETFGLVYAESMSQGLPVIYTRGQGFDGQFEEGQVGYSVNCFDASEIAEKIIETVNNYNQITENCIRYCDRFAWKRLVVLYELLYKNIKMGGI